MAADAAVAFDLLGVVAAVAVLWGGALLFVRGAAGLAESVGVPPVIVGLTIVGFGTSAPELVTSVGAALAGRADVAVGNVVGSNLFNFSIVLGVVLLLGAVPVGRALRRRDVPMVILATVSLAFVLSDLRLARTEGLALVGLFVAYMAVLLRSALSNATAAASGAADPGGTASGTDIPRTDVAGTTAPGTGTSDVTAAVVDAAPPVPDVAPATEAAPTVPLTRAWLAVRVVAGLGLVVFGADLLVGSAVDLARLAGLSEWVIGETVVAAGTSAPEIATSLVAARRGLGDVAIGNLVGSNVFNSLLVLGTAGAVAPAAVAPAALPPVAWLVGLTVLVAGFLWTGARLRRLEGVVCLVASGARWAVDLLVRGVPG